MKKYNYFSGFVFIFSFLILLSAFFNCSGKTEEELLLEAVDKIGEYAENRDISGLLSYVSDEYADDEGRTLEDIEKLVQRYLELYRGIVVNLLGKKIIYVTAPDAEIEAEVGLSSGAAKIFRKAVRYSGQFYRFKLVLVKEDEQWKVKKASWENISQGDLLPESVEIIKELFPNAL
ncbi:MAG: hypothetical protein GTO45_21030 [Candidatus Aminicenantes bacterium]|nr:hypothetical protein [Candidatus Aminicenantes bacterium]NIM82235.1 hypothetical protein [Candidatus Aminicenantes bacterium]NIN20648.1 hypothetical protein [Candidatus Aminicenantes bacterium]NIN44427.1 hypothetical protein [Candidatus Aminicenantes bacterium]NIN87246.1 hypothetical protein [Candidatus Aminicenantes bacterium]